MISSAGPFSFCEDCCDLIGTKHEQPTFKDMHNDVLNAQLH
jgi:hypothetical protein